MSILLNLYKQNLIHQKNDAEFQLLRNSARKQSFLSAHQGRFDKTPINSLENNLDVENLIASAQLSAINAELNALSSSKSLNYFA